MCFPISLCGILVVDQVCGSSWVRMSAVPESTDSLWCQKGDDWTKVVTCLYL